jgi:hypothetical protein
MDFIVMNMLLNGPLRDRLEQLLDVDLGDDPIYVMLR